MHGVAQALDAGKLFHIDLNDQAFGRYDQDFRFGAVNLKSAFFLVKLLEDHGYAGSRHFDAHAYRTEDYEGVKDFARGCMRTYLILKEKAAQWNADQEIQALVAEINADHGAMGKYRDCIQRKRPACSRRPSSIARHWAPVDSDMNVSTSSPSNFCSGCGKPCFRAAAPRPRRPDHRQRHVISPRQKEQRAQMQSTKKRATHLVSQMNLDEKLAQLSSYWVFNLQTRGVMDWEKTAEKLRHGIGQITRVAGASTLDACGAAKTANKLQKILVEQTRLGIPAILHEECCSGALMLGGTSFPQMIGLAATFEPDLAHAMATAIRKQLLAIGARQGLAPVLDIGRDPRWGRVEETFGEDPMLVSHFGVAYARGLQSEDLSQGVIATGKHFVGHSLSQGGLNCGPVHAGIHEIYDVYLAPFQAAIRDARLASIMNAYPELDGEVVAGSRRILTDLLRGQLGFDGLVVSDYEAIMMLHNFHRTAVDMPRAAGTALNAGIDVELPTVVGYGEPLRKALEQGDVGLDLVDLAVTRHLQKKLELGLFERPYVDEGKVWEVMETPEQRALALQIARKSMVLLKNDGTLAPAKVDQNPGSHRTQCGRRAQPIGRLLVRGNEPADGLSGI